MDWNTSYCYKAIFPKLIYRVSKVHIKNLAVYLPETDKLILKLTQKDMEPRIAKTILKKTKLKGSYC